MGGLVDAQARAGVDGMVLLPVTGRTDRVGELNRFSARAAKENPQIIPFGLLHPYGDLENDLELLLDLGLKGVKIHPLLQRFSLEDPRSDILFALVEETGLPLVTDTMCVEGLLARKPHLEVMRQFYGLQGCEPPQIASLARAHPRLKIVAAHGGSLYGWDRLGPLMELDNVYLDLAYLDGIIDPGLLLRIIQEKGPERVIYGSDYPMRDTVNFRAWFEDLGLSPGEKQQVQGHTLLSLLG